MSTLIKSDKDTKVLLTWASSLDGSLSAEIGRPTSISCNESMIFTHRLRATYDGILIGVGTVCSDDPSLTVRLCKGESPIPIILDPKLRIPLHCKLIQSAKMRKLYLLANSAFEKNVDVIDRKQILLDLGVHVLFCNPLISDINQINLHDAICRLRIEIGIKSIMVEGGQRVLQSFILQHLELKNQSLGKLVNQVIVTIAPKLLLGGVNLGLGFPTGLVNMPLELQNTTWEVQGTDVILTGSI
jgi:riboflavin-specific deaminase-like protein